jgi:hypothetical protein
MYRVREGLYLADWAGAHDRTLLVQNGIRHILNMCPGDNDEDDILMYNKLGITVQQHAMTEEEYPVDERVTNDEILAMWHSAHKRIVEGMQKHEPILVHCVEGKNRSVSTCIFHLMQAIENSHGITTSHGITLDEALAHMLAVRPNMEVDKTFILLLLSVSPSHPYLSSSTSSSSIPKPTEALIH